MSYYQNSSNDPSIQSFNGNNSIELDQLWQLISKEITEMETPRMYNYDVVVLVLVLDDDE
jgi:hypothetical protein